MNLIILEILQSDWAALLSAAEQILHRLDPRPPVLYGRPGHTQLHVDWSHALARFLVSMLFGVSPGQS